MKEVFVSYTQKDKDTAFLLVRYLEDKGISCFIAPRDVDPGKAYASNLMDALENCKLVLLVASKAINESEHVLNEVDVIIEKKKTLLPVFVEEFDLNDDFRYYLGRKQRILAYPEQFDKYLSNILMSVQSFLPLETNHKQSEIKEEETTKKTKTIFEYVPERGIMINPEDHQRNVSFRTDTLTNMMGGIFDKVVEMIDEEKAKEIFFHSGYISGKNFADRIYNQWDTGVSVEDLKNKLKKWCVFDSSVGWGKFDIEIVFNDEDESLSGTLTISEAILVDKVNKRKVCTFIKGYCTGVIEALLGVSGINLVCLECPLKNKFKNQCVFKIEVRDEE